MAKTFIFLWKPFFFSNLSQNKSSKELVILYNLHITLFFLFFWKVVITNKFLRGQAECPQSSLPSLNKPSDMPSSHHPKVHPGKSGEWELNRNWLCGFISILHLQSYYNATGSRSLQWKSITLNSRICKSQHWRKPSILHIEWECWHAIECLSHCNIL